MTAAKAVDANPDVSPSSESAPLCVDLDGTLINTDSFFELSLKLLQTKPLALFQLCMMLLRVGIPEAKQWLANQVELDVTTLPYNKAVLDYAQAESNQREVWLCTGSDQKLAQQVAEHLGFFTGVIASDGVENCTGKTKARILCDKFGTGNFDYIGNEKKDCYVWQKARQALLATNSKRLESKISEQQTIDQVFWLPKLTFKHIIKSIRVHQWSKNVLIFVPIMLAHNIDTTSLLTQATIAFFSFSLLASATYIFNDLMDLESDRVHHTKKHRPYAAGTVSIATGLTMMPLLLVGSIVLALMLPPLAIYALLLYGVTTLAYTFVLKKMATIDVCTLAGLYTLRIILGMIIVAQPWSFWLLAFSLFFFLSLGLAKRVTEITNKMKQQSGVLKNSGYSSYDLQQLIILGNTSGLISVLVIALYINSDKVLTLYSVPEALWLICPLMLFWVARFWLITCRGKLNEDPVLFAIKDRISLLLGVVMFLIITAASGEAVYAWFS